MTDAEERYVIRKSVGSAAVWQGRGPRLPHLDVELTERCNNACMHCYINLPQEDRQALENELNTQEWRDVLRQAAVLGALSVRMTGGEPLLREDFTELYLYARRLGLQVQLYTNARGVTEALAELFEHTPPRRKIEVTVYGMSERSYEAAACAPGAYAEFRQGVERLLAHNTPFTIKMALLPPNLEERSAFAAWHARLPWSEGAPSYIASFDLRGRRDSPQRNLLIEGLRFPAEQNITLQAKLSEGELKEMRQFCGRFMGPAGDRLFACGAGRSLSVDAYGRCQPCLLLRAPDLSVDLRQASLQAALEGFPSRLGELRAQNPAYLERCATCFLRGLCEQCPAKSWAEHGTLDTPVEHACQAAHVLTRRLELLEEGETAWTVKDWHRRVAQFTEASA